MTFLRRFYLWQTSIPLLVSESKTRDAFRIARRVKKAGDKPLYSTYISLLQGIDQLHQANTAVKLYCEANNQMMKDLGSTKSERKAIEGSFLQAMRHLNDPSHLMVIGPDKLIAHRLAKLHILLSSDCLNQALDLWWEYPIFDSVVTLKLILQLLTSRNTSELFSLLKAMSAREYGLQSYQWIAILELGLTNNHYELVKFCFDEWFGPKKLITSSTMVLQGFKAPNLTNSMLERLLQCLSLHGDVEYVMQVVETYFLHKLAKGERGLTTQLRSYIISAYCHHKDDTSLIPVLDAIVTLSKGDAKMTYRDISQQVSHKLHHYRGISDNVALLKINQRMHVDINRSTNDESVWKKGHSLVKGNALNNITVLETITEEIFLYLKDKDIKAIRIILNSLLLHLAENQNFSAIVKALSVIHRIEPNFTKWLDEDSWDIMFMLAGNLGAKLCCLALSKLSPSKPLSAKRLANCIISSLRGEIHRGLQFWIYQYLLAYQVDQRLKVLVGGITSDFEFDNEGTRQLLHCIKTGAVPGNLDDFWRDHRLNRDESCIAQGDDAKNPRKYFATYDKRDYESLRYIFIKCI